MINTELSDLFFEHSHPHYDACENWAEMFNSPTKEDQAVIEKTRQIAIMQDATDFVEAYPMTCGFVTPSELATDFLRRL